ncbi:MAG: transposase [Mycobacteriaceae bacterium]|nr:transposase [Mycobacteriaceae bacterium]
MSDRETAEAARCDLRWKVATGMPLDHKGFDPSTLVYWRRRLAKSKRPHRINEAVRQVVEQSGIVRGRRKRAVDSTILADAVATQDTITQLTRRSDEWGGSCPAGPRRSPRCAPRTTTTGRASRSSTGTSPARRTRWCPRWSTTRTRC